MSSNMGKNLILFHLPDMLNMSYFQLLCSGISCVHILRPVWICIKEAHHEQPNTHFFKVDLVFTPGNITANYHVCIIFGKDMSSSNLLLIYFELSYQAVD